MERKNLDDIIHSIETGRAISPVGVRNAAVALMETMVPRMVNSDYEGRDFWTITLFGFAQPVRMGKNYWDVVGGLERQAVFHKDTPAALYMSLASLHGWGSDSVMKWMSFGVEDVMREAGFDQQYEEWFGRESGMWEAEHGRVPSVGDIMEIAFDIEWEDDYKVQPYMERPDGYFPEKIAEPFKRSSRELGVKPVSTKSDLEEAKHKYIRLVSTWIWLLMVEAPARIYFNNTDKDLVQSEENI